MGATRWRDSPRRTLRRWDLDKGYALYAILAGGLWVATVARLVDVVVGRDRAANTTALVVTGALAVALTWLAVAYLRRPVLDPPPEPPPPTEDAAARDESERRAWQNR